MQLLTTIFILFYFLFNWKKIWVVTRSLRMRISRFNRKMKLTKTVQKISKNSWSNLRGSHNCPPCIRHCQHPCITILLLFGLVWFFYLNILIPFLIFYLFTSSLLTRNLAIANKLWSPSHNILLVKYNSRYTCSRMMFDYYTLYIRFAAFWDTDSETVYSTWSDLERSLKLIGNWTARSTNDGLADCLVAWINEQFLQVSQPTANMK